MEIKFTMVQSDIIWENIPENLFEFEKKLVHYNEFSDVFILPEMFNTGFSMNANALYEEMEGPTMEWMRKMALRFNAVFCGSLIIKENGRYFNRFIWMEKDGNYQYYDKRHLFQMSGEGNAFSPGEKQLFIEWGDFKIYPQICYDLRFPVWARNTTDYDIYLNVANWPEKRVGAWEQLLIARAIENQCYVIGVNRVGKDENGHVYSGNSMTVGPLGEILINLENKEQLVSIRCNKTHLANIRKELPFLKDRDTFEIITE
jgi:omega-amidase